MIQVTQPIASLLINGSHRFATLWKLTRTDGVSYYFTDHNTKLDYQGNSYTPIASVNSTARQRETGLSNRNTDIRGIIKSSAITDQDLRVGKFRGCRIIEIIVDWKAPWLGAISEQIYYLTSTKFNAELWDATLTGITYILRQRLGSVYTRTCEYSLGDADCTIDIEALRVTGTVVSILNQRRWIETDVLNTDATYFKLGELTWTSGLNTNVKREIKNYAGASGRLNFYLPTPFDIAVGDDFTMVPGCNKFFRTCRLKYANQLNYGGQPDIIGTDALLRIAGS